MRFFCQPIPLATNLGYEPGWTGLGLGLGGLRNKGLGPGLDNKDRLYKKLVILEPDHQLVEIYINNC